MFRLAVGIFLGLLAFKPINCQMDRINPSKLTGHLWNAAKEVILPSPPGSNDETTGASSSTVSRKKHVFFD